MSAATLKLSPSASKATNARRFPQRPGRLICVDNVYWKWQCGKSGSVIAYSELGDRALSKAWDLNGCSAYTWERGQRKKTSDGMLSAGAISAWLKLQKISVSA